MEIRTFERDDDFGMNGKISVNKLTFAMQC